MPAPSTPYGIQPLGKSHDRAQFSCGNLALDRYLQLQARQDAEKSVAAPFVLTEGRTHRVLGYYTLSASVVNADELPDSLVRKLPRYPQLPVILLGRLALDVSMRGQGLGQFLLMDALHRCLQAVVNIAAMAVVVDAKDDAAETFYSHFGFLPFQAHPRRLFLSMKVVRRLFES